MEGFALMPQRETSAAAVAALQEDLASSVAARLEVPRMKEPLEPAV